MANGADESRPKLAAGSTTGVYEELKNAPSVCGKCAVERRLQEAVSALKAKKDELHEVWHELQQIEVRILCCENFASGMLIFFWSTQAKKDAEARELREQLQTMQERAENAESASTEASRRADKEQEAKETAQSHLGQVSAQLEDVKAQLSTRHRSLQEQLEDSNAEVERLREEKQQQEAQLREKKRQMELANETSDRQTEETSPHVEGLENDLQKGQSAGSASERAGVAGRTRAQQQQQKHSDTEYVHQLQNELLSYKSALKDARSEARALRRHLSSESDAKHSELLAFQQALAEKRSQLAVRGMHHCNSRSIWLLPKSFLSCDACR